MTRGVMALGLAALALSSGCMTLAVATRGADRPTSHAVAGGVIGDVALAAITSYGHGSAVESEDASPYFATYFGVLTALDAVGAILVYQLRGQVEAPSTAEPID